MTSTGWLAKCGDWYFGDHQKTLSLWTRKSDEAAVFALRDVAIDMALAMRVYPGRIRAVRYPIGSRMPAWERKPRREFKAFDEQLRFNEETRIAAMLRTRGSKGRRA